MHRRLYKVRKHLGLTQKHIADILGIGQNAYSMIETGRISLTDRNRAILAERLYINPVFLTEGRGEMLLSTLRTDNQSLVVAAGAREGVPYFSKPFNGLRLADMLSDNPDYYINFEPFNDCTLYRPVFGESMSPRYNKGDIVACKLVNNKEQIMFGEAFLCLVAMDGDRYETIKILRQSPIKGQVILMPCNEAFDPTTMMLDAISELYIIKGKIERNI